MVNRILFVAWAPFYSGAERALLLLADHLDRARYCPVVAVGTDNELATALRERDIETVRIPIARTGIRTLPQFVASVWKLARLAHRAGAVLIHSNDAPSFQPAGFAARLVGVPSVVHIRFPDSGEGFRWFLKPGFARAVFVSADLRATGLEVAPDLFEAKSEVIYDGVLLPNPCSADERSRIRRDLGVPDDRPAVVLSGQVAEVKGIWEFIEAARLLSARSVPVSFAVLGEDLRGRGALRAEAERRVAELGLKDVVRFLGFRTDAPSLISAFDIVAVPSHVEPLGNATLEGMAAGLPVVGSRVGGIPEMIVDGITGTLVPSRDPLALAGAIEALARDPDLAQARGAAGKKRAVEVFGARAHAARVQELYDRVLSSAAPKRSVGQS
jgi:glycosyltransferase involved in cell wall biosynthesis